MKTNIFLYNNVEDINLGIFNESEFIHKIREIAVENEDEDMSITCLDESLNYVKNYCDNLNYNIIPDYITDLDVNQIISDLGYIATEGLRCYILLNYVDDDFWKTKIENLLYEYFG